MQTSRHRPAPRPTTSRFRLFSVLAVVVVGATSLVACSDDAGQPANDAAKVTVPPSGPLDAAKLAALQTEVEAHPDCDPLGPGVCFLPFPSNRFTKPDDTSPTKRRVSFPAGQLANAAGSAWDPTEWNRNDGFSPGSPLMALLPGVDLGQSKLATQGDIAASLAQDSGSMVLDLDTGRPLAHFVELDSHATDPARRLLIIRMAAALPEGHHVGVALIDVKDGKGSAIESPPAFVAYRDNRTTGIDAVESRRPAMEELFASLAKVGVDRSKLTLAWDFTVASQESLAGRMLHMRDDAFGSLADKAPAFDVSEVIKDGLPDGIGRRVRGTFSVPSYLDGAGEPGSRMTFDSDGKVPQRAGYNWQANFTCQIPTKALTGPGSAARPVVYGHGLLGSAKESENSQVAKIASTNLMMYCATDWLGMSSSDIGQAVKVLGDISLFPTMADRLQQGMLDALFLARAMVKPDGFASNEAFHNDAGVSVIDTATAYYDGNSQGAIVGGAVTALAQDWTRAVLGVPGMNYSMLLTRSVDFDEYFAVLRAAYPDVVDQQVIFGILQMLWDRGEANGYAQHMTTDPYPGTPEHHVILDVAFGDHQVANVAAEYEARTIGARLRVPSLADGRHPDAKPFYGLDPIESYPFDGSALIYWDSGTLPAPAGNVTPATSDAFRSTCATVADPDEDARCADPHEDPRRAPDSIEQKGSFFRLDGAITDTCDAKPCVSPPRFTLDY